MVLAVFPPNTGGNFFINSLSFSNKIALRDARIARDHLRNPWSAQQKLVYFQTQLQMAKETGIWNDLNLGCAHLFGIDSFEWLTGFPEIIGRKIDTVVSRLINHNQYLFLINHWSVVTLPRMLELWPNAKLILFSNYRSFLKQRNTNIKTIPSLDQYWQQVRAETWPHHAPKNHQEFSMLDSAIQQELVNDFDFEISRYFDYNELYDTQWNQYIKILAAGNNSHFLIDIDDAYSSADNVVSWVEQCADWLGIEDVHQDCVKIYFQDWINTLDVISQHALPR